jgi:hypothetical protein
MVTVYLTCPIDRLFDPLTRERKNSSLFDLSLFVYGLSTHFEYIYNGLQIDIGLLYD